MVFLRYILTVVTSFSATAWSPLISLRQSGAVILLGSTGISACNLLFFSGFQTVESGRAALVSFPTPDLNGILRILWRAQKTNSGTMRNAKRSIDFRHMQELACSKMSCTSSALPSGASLHRPARFFQTNRLIPGSTPRMVDYSQRFQHIQHNHLHRHAHLSARYDDGVLA